LDSNKNIKFGDISLTHNFDIDAGNTKLNIDKTDKITVINKIYNYSVGVVCNGKTQYIKIDGVLHDIKNCMNPTPENYKIIGYIREMCEDLGDMCMLANHIQINYVQQEHMQTLDNLTRDIKQKYVDTLMQQFSDYYIENGILHTNLISYKNSTINLSNFEKIVVEVHKLLKQTYNIINKFHQYQDNKDVNIDKEEQQLQQHRNDVLELEKEDTILKNDTNEEEIIHNPFSGKHTEEYGRSNNDLYFSHTNRQNSGSFI
jgi:hypothetical protein